MGKCCRELLWGSVAGTCCEEVLYREVLWGSAAGTCCEEVL